MYCAIFRQYGKHGGCLECSRCSHCKDVRDRSQAAAKKSS